MQQPFVRRGSVWCEPGLLFVVAWGLIGRREVRRLWAEGPLERVTSAVALIDALTSPTG